MLQRMALLGATNNQAALWTPAQITTALWLDAATGPFYDAISGGNLVTANNSKIARWEDKSGNSLWASRSNIANQATLSAASQNGLSGVLFDGTSQDFDLNGSLAAFQTISQSFLIVAKRSNASGRTEIVFSIGESYAGNGIVEIPRWSDNNTYSQVGAASARIIAPSAITNVSYINTVIGGSNQQVFTNGALLATGSTQTEGIGSVFTGSIGSGRAVSGLIRYFAGLIYEIIVSPSVWSSSQRQIVEGYAAWKWGLQANLPSNHPYKSAAPTV